MLKDQLNKLKPKSKILIIAGSDSSGGAGIQADIKTVTSLGSYALTIRPEASIRAAHPAPITPAPTIETIFCFFNFLVPVLFLLL